MNKESNLLKRFQEIDSRIIYALLIIVVSYTVIRPIGLPISIDNITQDAFNAVDDLPEGSVVLFGFDSGARELPDTGPQAVTLLNHLFAKNLKVIVFSIGSPESPTLFKWVEDRTRFHGAQYGVDWVNLGWSAGGAEVVAAAVAQDIHSVYTIDAYGTSIEELELMENIRSVDDIDFLVSCSVTPALLRQFNSAYGTPMISGSGGLKTSEYLPFYNPLQLKGIVIGMQGAAKYERLLVLSGYETQYGIGTQNLDALSGSYIVVFAMILFGNIVYILDRYGRGNE